MLREKAQSVTTARPKVPMRRLGAHCLVVAMKRGNARGAKGVGHQRWIGSTGVGSTGSGRNLIINGRRQPSHGGTSRMMREYHVRICEGLGCNSPGLLGRRGSARPRQLGLNVTISSTCLSATRSTARPKGSRLVRSVQCASSKIVSTGFCRANVSVWKASGSSRPSPHPGAFIEPWSPSGRLIRRASPSVAAMPE